MLLIIYDILTICKSCYLCFYQYPIGHPLYGLMDKFNKVMLKQDTVNILLWLPPKDCAIAYCLCRLRGIFCTGMDNQDALFNTLQSFVSALTSFLPLHLVNNRVRHIRFSPSSQQSMHAAQMSITSSLMEVSRAGYKQNWAYSSHRW